MIDNANTNFDLPPRSLESEAALLGSVLLDSSAMDDVAESVGVGDFHKPEHGIAWSLVEALHREGQAVDLVKIKELAERRGCLEAMGGLNYLIELAESVPSASSAGYYAEVVRDCALRRQLIEVAHRMQKSAHHDKGADVLESVQQQVFDLATTGSSGFTVRPLGELLHEVYDDMSARAEGKVTPGLKTGFHELDSLIPGMRPGEVFVIGGRPGSGKTSFAINVAEQVAAQGTPVGCFSLEMSDKSLAARILSGQSGVSANVIRSPDRAKAGQWADLAQTIGRLADVPLHIADTPGLGIETLHSMARKMVMRQGVELLVIDYLQIMGRRAGSSDNQAVGELSRRIKQIARQLNVPVILLSQLSREVEKREDKIPRLSDLRDTGSIEQDADVVIFLYRHDYYEQQKNPHYSTDGGALAIVSKQRDGATGVRPLYFVADRTRFIDWPLGHPKPSWMEGGID